MTPWEAILADPTVPMDRETLRIVVRDQQRWTRRWLYPVVRLVSRLAVALIRPVPRPSAHSTMDRLCVWFLHRFVSPDAGALLIRHFLVETNLLNVIAVNTGLAQVKLRPTTLTALGNRAVIEHDLNVYEVLLALGRMSPRPGPQALDLSMLTVEPVDAAPGVRRWLNLDIQTALCLMNIPFALCLTRDEYDRAVHSLRLDESLLAILADLTGDETFLRWRPGTTVVRVDSTLDVPRAVYEHAVICEYAHEHLRRYRDRMANVTLRPAVPADAVAVARIWSEGWRDGHLGNVPDDLVAIRTEESFGTRAAERVGDTTVAVADGTVAGFVMVVADEVEQVYVAADHRGTGVAAALIAEAERLVAAGGHGRAWLAVVAGNARARAFYARNGWTDEGLFDYTAKAATGTISVPCHRYAKRLTAGSSSPGP